MSQIKDNIDPDLTNILKKAEGNVSEILNEKNSITNNKVNKSLCCCAILFPTVQTAYNALQKGRTVYILRRKENGGKIKERAFSQCSRKCSDETVMCKKHCSMDISKITKWNDLVNNEMSSIATLKSSFFTKKGDKIKSLKSNIDANIQKVLDDVVLSKKLIKYAQELLSMNKKPSLSITLDNVTENISKTDNPLLEDNNELTDDESNLEEDEELDNKNSSNEEDESSEEEVECEEIKTIDGRTLYLDPINNKIYNPEGDNSGNEFANFIEVEYKKAPIKYKEKYYICGVKFEYEDTEYIKCKLTNKVFSFDEPHEFIGKITEKKGEIKLKKVKKKSK